MPNHWETSARPLFVKTVFVNGNRHAILFEKDPLLPFGNSPSKKISRSNSSLSFASDLSTCSLESQTNNSESKTFKARKTGQREGKDWTSDLQNCLVKLKLSSTNLENKNSPGEEKCCCSSKELKKSQNLEKGSLKQKKLKWNRDEICNEMPGEHFYENSKDRKLTGRKNSKRSSSYVYSIENNQRKKKYCFVKISSQPPQFILNCSCEDKSKEPYNCEHSRKNNLVISATIHNLVMTSKECDNLFEHTFDYVTENSEGRWNNYLARSNYNSFSDRVFQWLYLARNKKFQKETFVHDDDSLNNTERIFSGKTYMNEIKESENSIKSDNKILMSEKMKKNFLNETHEEEIEKEVSGKINVEKAISAETTYDFQGNILDTHTFSKDFNKLTEENIKHKILKSNINSEVTSNETDVNLPLKTCSKNSTITKLNLPISNLIKSPLKIQDLLLKYDSKESYSFRNQKVNETHKKSTYRNKHKEAENSEEDSIILTHRSWEEKKKKKNIFKENSDNSSKHSRCCCNKNLDEYVDKIKDDILMKELALKKQKSINNLNILQTSPVSIHNLVYPQQQSKLTYFKGQEIVWGLEKNTGRPQLHIFLPTMRLKDQSDDSMSECENFLNM